ncbi:MAG: DUF3597 domain-containing protein [Shinella sp.]|uniref:DUF3597 domain-containing protein n=1 Tax=Shinella sp. TaxID=1870904 RepID=UPI003C75A65C
MGIFSSIKEKLFGKAAQDTSAETAANETITAGSTKPVTADVSATPTTAGNDAAAKPAENKTAGAAVDVAAIMDAAVKKNGQKLDWRRSIVDMMKALDLDSSLSARKELADELGYTGDKNDSATMNVWLHKALMKALAENGGKVPADLLD